MIDRKEEHIGKILEHLDIAREALMAASDSLRNRSDPLSVMMASYIINKAIFDLGCE